MTDKPIIPVSYGLASSYDDEIEINRNLDGDLRERILQHELRHEKGNTYTKGDFMNDFNSQNSYFKESLMFCIRNPMAFIGFFPLMWSYYYKKMTFNTSAVPPFFFFGVIFVLFWWIALGFNPLYTIITYTTIIIGLNGILMGLTHYLLKKTGLNY